MNMTQTWFKDGRSVSFHWADSGLWLLTNSAGDHGFIETEEMLDRIESLRASGWTQVA